MLNSGFRRNHFVVVENRHSFNRLSLRATDRGGDAV